MRQTDRISDVSIMQERFFIRLLNNLFENETQYLTQAKELNLSFPYAGYAAAHLEMQLPGSSGTRLSQEQLLKLYNSTLHMLQELLGKYLPCGSSHWIPDGWLPSLYPGRKHFHMEGSFIHSPAPGI